MLLLSLLSISGLTFGIRKMRSQYQKFGFSTQIIETTAWCYLVFVFVIIYFSHKNYFFIGISLLFLNFFSEISLFLANKALEHRLREQFPTFLDQIVLGIQSGLTFRSAFLFSIEQLPAWEQQQFKQLYSFFTKPTANMNFSSQYFTEFAREMIKIDQSQSKCVDQIKQLRRQYKIEFDFRRRSGQIMQQIRAQALIVGALYFALLVFVTKEFGLYKNWRLILTSVFLFVAGQLWIFIGGRKLKWKV